MKTPDGLMVDIAIECTCPDTGKTGCWFFSGESHRNAGSRQTPIFADLGDLFHWAVRNRWEPIAGTYRYRYNAQLADHGEQVAAYMAEHFPNII